MNITPAKENQKYKKLPQRKTSMPTNAVIIACSKNRRTKLTETYNRIANQEMVDIIRTVKTLKAVKLK